MQTSRQTFPVQRLGCIAARLGLCGWLPFCSPLLFLVDSRDIISHKNWHFYCGVHCIHIIKCKRSFYRCHDRDILLLLQNLQSCKENTKNRGAHFKENRVCSSNDSRGSNTTDVKVSKTCFSVPFLYCNVD